MANITIYPYGVDQQLPSSDNLIYIQGELSSSSQLPSTGKPGEGWVISGDLWVWSSGDGEFIDVGPFRGPQGIQGPVGVTSVYATVDANVGTPAVTATLVGQALSFAFSNMKGAKGDQGIQGIQGPQGEQGNTGSSVDYPYELVNNRITDDATKGLSAAEGKRLGDDIGQLDQKVGDTSVFDEQYWNPVAVTPTTGCYFKYDSLAEYEQPIAQYASLSVQPGEKYKIDGWNFSSNAPLAFVLKAGTTTKARAISQSSSGHMNGEYTIPDGYDTLYINGRTENYPVSVQKWIEESRSLSEVLQDAATETAIEQSKPLHVAVVENSNYVAGSNSVKGVSLYVGQRFDNTHDSVWVIGNKNSTINRFFDFYKIYLASRGTDGINPEYLIVNLSYVLGHETDYILPIRVKAVNNINGDFTGDENYFTGGFHGYGNNTSGDYSQTMREVSKTILLDGKALAAGDSLYGRRLEMVVVNNVQASNTEKEDGTGREVIQETIRCVLTGDNTMQVEVEWTALEEIDINTLHCFGQYLDFSNVRFVGSSSKMGVYANNVNTNPSDERTNAIRNYGNDYAFEVGMDKTFCLGDGRSRDGRRNAFATTAVKGYFNVLKDDGTPIRLQQGDMVAYRGYFKFTKA